MYEEMTDVVTPAICKARLNFEHATGLLSDGLHRTARGLLMVIPAGYHISYSDLLESAQHLCGPATGNKDALS